MKNLNKARGSIRFPRGFAGFYRHIHKIEIFCMHPTKEIRMTKNLIKFYSGRTPEHIIPILKKKFKKLS